MSTLRVLALVFLGFLSLDVAALEIDASSISESAAGETAAPVSSRRVVMSSLPEVTEKAAIARSHRLLIDPSAKRRPGDLIGGHAKLLSADSSAPPLAAIDSATRSISGGYIPPDSHGAVGPNHVVTVVNSLIRIADRAGNVVSQKSLQTFFGSSDFLFDARALYDPQQQQWFITAAQGETSSSSFLWIAGSLSADPTAGWQILEYQADQAGQLWADFPSAGFSSSMLAVSANMFSSTDVWTYTKIWVVVRSGYFLGSAFAFVPSPSCFTTAPAEHLDVVSVLYTVCQDPGHSSNGLLQIGRFSLSNGVPQYTPVIAYAAGTPWYDPVGAFFPEAGTTIKIDGIDARISHAVYRNGSLWATHHIEPKSGPIRAAVQWWQITPTTGQVLQRDTVEDSSGSQFYGFPSIAVNKYGDALLGFSIFSASIYPSAGYSTMMAPRSNDFVRTVAFEQPRIVKSGIGISAAWDGSRYRWGDYSHAVVDPSNDADVWTIQEWQGNVDGNDWRTSWLKTSPPLEWMMRHYYNRILGRTADDGGLAYWMSDIERLRSIGVDPRETLQVLAKTFFSSQEYLNRARSDSEYVDDLYEGYYNRAADAGGKQYWLDQMAGGLNRDAVLVNFEYASEFNDFINAMYAQSITERPEYTFEMGLYRAIFARTPDSGGFNYWVGRLKTAQCQGSGALNAEAQYQINTYFGGAEYSNRNRTNPQFVSDAYEAVMQRGPDTSGFNYFVAQLNSGGMSRQAVLNAFYASQEWATVLTRLMSAGCSP